VDNRPRWTNNRINSNVANATVLKNQSVGYNWNFAASIEKPFSDGLFYKVGYYTGQARNTIDPGSIASGTWQSNQMSGDPNNPGVSLSSYTPGKRLFAAVTYRREYFDFGATAISVMWDYYQPGTASYVFSGDLNNDGSTNNDLIYIPRDKSEMNFQTYSTTIPGTTYNYAAQQHADAWDAYIQQDEYLSKNRGKYAERNAVDLPMVSRIDLGISQEVFADFLGKRNSLQFRADILNFGNLLNSNWGVSQSMVSTFPLVVPSSAQGGQADATGKVQYRLRNINGKLIEKTFQKV
jgi:hypothetical protein